VVPFQHILRLQRMHVLES
jgi:hypothetical protein